MLIYAFAKVTEVDKLELLFPGDNGCKNVWTF